MKIPNYPCTCTPLTLHESLELRLGDEGLRFCNGGAREVGEVEGVEGEQVRFVEGFDMS